MKRTLTVLAATLLLAGCSDTGNIFGFKRGGPDEFTVVRNPPLSVPPDATLRPPVQGEASKTRDLSSSEARASLMSSGSDAAGSAGTLVTDQGAVPYNGGARPSGQDTASALPSQPAATPQPQRVASTSDPQATTAGNGTAVAGSYPPSSMPSSPQYGAAGIPVQYGPNSGPSAGEAALAQRAMAYYGVEPDVRRKVDAESADLAMANDSFLNKVLFWQEPPPPGAALDANAEARRLRENEALGKPLNAGEAPIIARKKTGISSLF
jgi:hypothetical protein